MTAMNLRNKTVAITGAAQGIGRALALELAAAGADLALIDLGLERLAETLSLVRTHGVSARAYAANVADESEVETAAERIVTDFGRFDGLVNNAGILRDALLVKVRDGQVTGRMSLEQWRAVIDVNLTGVFLCGRAAAERMIKLGSGGVIVNISSISRHGNAGQSNYSAAKAGVVALTQVWSKELARFKIRTGSIAPGFVNTEILAAMKP
jgi:3-oxoacyl-[acyl-carrier protein] reductase